MGIVFSSLQLGAAVTAPTPSPAPAMLTSYAWNPTNPNNLGFAATIGYTGKANYPVQITLADSFAFPSEDVCSDCSDFSACFWYNSGSHLYLYAMDGWANRRISVMPGQSNRFTLR